MHGSSTISQQQGSRALQTPLLGSRHAIHEQTLILAVPLGADAGGPGSNGAWADAPTSSVIVGNGHVTLGVGYDAGLNEAGTGLQFVPTGTEGLAQMCVCSAW